MTLISSIIGDAYREANILPLGRAPNDNQVTEALRLYNGNVRSIYAGDAGENLTDWPIGTYGRQAGYILPYTDDTLTHPCSNVRFVAGNTEAKTLYLPAFPQDGARIGMADPFGRLAAFPVTLDANGRTIEGNPTLVLNTNGLFQEWFYRADLGQWVKISSLLATDDNPFPDDFDTFFTIGLALRLNPRNGRSMDDQTALVFKSERRQFIARYLQAAPLEIDDSLSWPFMSAQSYNQARQFSSNTAFNRGWYGAP